MDNYSTHKTKEIHEHGILDEAVVSAGREFEQMVEGTALESAKVGCARPFRPNAVRGLQSEHVDERKASRGIFAEKFQSEEIWKVFPDALVLVHEVAGSDFDTLPALQSGVGITFHEAGNITLEPDEPCENCRDGCRARGLLKDDAACPCARLGGSCKDEAEKPRYALARQVLAEPADDAIEQGKAPTELSD